MTDTTQIGGQEQAAAAARAQIGHYQPPADLLADRVILITGAGDGIGRELALACAGHGAHVLLLGRTVSKLEAVYDDIVALDRGAAGATRPPWVVPMDLAETALEGPLDELQTAISEQWGQLDGLVHNAGLLGSRVPLRFYDDAEFDRVLRVNVTSQQRLTRTLYPLLEVAPDASVVFTTSGVGVSGRAYWGAYAISKFATEGMAQVFAAETAETSNIRVNVINPGGTRTTMRAMAYPAEDPATLPAPADHMPAYLFLLGPDSRPLTGERLDMAQWHR